MSAPRSSPIWTVLYSLAILGIVAVLLGLGVMFAYGGLVRVSAWYLFQFVPPLLALLVLALVGLNLVVTRRFSKVSAYIGGLSLLLLTPALLMIFPVTYPASLEKTSPAATVRLPANVPLTVGWGGDTKKVNYHVFVPDQRWAYDLLVQPAFHGSAVLADYGAYGIPIVAPAEGTIAVAHDGEPDMAPGVLSQNFTSPLGNHIAIMLNSGTYLIIAHLKPGSLLVKEGDKITEGQPLAACGNSGNTSEPHIHIHHQRQNPKDYPVNFAEGLPLYFRDHDGPPMPTGGIEVQNGLPKAIGAVVRHLGK